MPNIFKSRGGRILPALLTIIALLSLSPVAGPVILRVGAAGLGAPITSGASRAADNTLKFSEQAAAVPTIVFPLDGDITSPFAWRIDPFYDPASGEDPTYEFHRGIDISAARSRDILACADGVVSFTGYDPGYGLYMIISHESFESLYAHCSSLLIEVGESVAAGESVAVAGSTGRSTGPHLHFEIRVKGEHVDPLEYVGCVFTGKIY